MSRRAKAAIATALALAATPAAAWRRTEAVANGQVIAGRCLWWSADQVRYRVNQQFADASGCTDKATQLQLVQQSLATWGAARLTGASAACTGFRFLFDGASSSTTVGYVRGGANENLIVFRSGRCDAVVPGGDPCLAVPGACSDQYGCWEKDHVSAGTIALTTTSFDANTGEILDADMELFGGNPSLGSGYGYWFTCADATAPLCKTSASSPAGCVSMDLGGTVTHESGHMLGLGHTCDLNVAGSCAQVSSATTMFPSGNVGDPSKRVLAQDDVVGVCTIYPVGRAPQSLGGYGESGSACQLAPAAEPAKSTGCSTTGGGAGLALALAGLARVRLRGAPGRLRLRRR